VTINNPPQEIQLRQEGKLPVIMNKSELHERKERGPRNPTDAGRQIDFNDEQTENVDASIRITFDPNSNVHGEMEMHDETPGTHSLQNG
jgi:hypothetical protein